MKFVLLFIALTFLSNTIKAQPLEVRTLAYQPYQYKEGEEVKGFQVEIVKAVFKKLGKEIKIAVRPWARIIAEIENGEADVLFSAYKKPEREKFAYYSKEVLMEQQVKLFVKKGSSITFNGDLNSMAKYKFGVVRSMSYGPSLDDAMKSGMLKNLSFATDVSQNAQKFGLGRYDIFPSDRYVAYAEFKKQNLEGAIKELPTAVQKVPAYIIFSKKRKLSKLRDQFDEVLAKMKKSGEYDKIIQANL